MKHTRAQLAALARQAINEVIDYIPRSSREQAGVWITELRQTLDALSVPNVPLASVPPPGFVRVRVAVAITQKAQWRAWGSIGAGDPASSDQAVEGLEEDGLVHFIEADVPVPQQSIVVEGVVK